MGRRDLGVQPDSLDRHFSRAYNPTVNVEGEWEKARREKREAVEILEKIQASRPMKPPGRRSF